MSKIRLHGSSSGYTEIAPVAASGNNTLTLPNDGTIISKDSNGAVGVTSVTVGTGVTIGDGRVTANSFVTGGAALLSGITEVDQWYTTANITSNGTITSSLSRNALTGSGCPLGTGMSQSSGVFSFPSTGKYLVICKAAVVTDDSDNVYIGTMVTTDNSSYTGVAYAGDGNNGSGSREGQGTTFYLLDVTDVGQVKVKFNITSITGSSFVKGNASDLATAFTFIRIGDT